MLFLTQKDDLENYNLEIYMLKSIISKSRGIDSFADFSLSDFFEGGDIKDKDRFPAEISNAIPIGTIDFVTAWLRSFHDINREHPIEVPPCLRTDEFLKRSYSIRKAKDVPKNGRFFIKDASILKLFSYSGELSGLFSGEGGFDKIILDDSHLYQVSEIVDILSEYRVYVIDGKIDSVVNYDGDPLVFPDVSLIKKACMIYSCQQNSPLSYTMDIMVTNRGTSVIEIHNYTSVGQYGSLVGHNILTAYRDGIDYLLNYNVKPIEFTNF